ncbi:hypothetical protein QBC43DRAFT_310410 [Cladorrhinum sp. PSN259]|nr:hypothetical protein QBC43DRAFT_310410 [Cladorrhinum sp. PSN259]
MDPLRQFFSCLLFRSRAREGYTELIYDYPSSESPSLFNEKYTDYPPPEHDEQYQPDCMTLVSPVINSNNQTDLTILASQLAHTLYFATENDENLQSRILSVVGSQKWNRRLLEELLDEVITYIEGGRTDAMGEAFLTALDTVTDLADEEFTFPRNHPESVDGFIAIVGVGVLASLLGGWCLELLGFGIVVTREEDVEGNEKETGVVKMSASDKVTLGDRPRRGSVADWWAREFGGYIPRGGVYKFLQRLDVVEE